MTLKLYPEQDIQDIASAIRTKNGSSDLYTVGEMAQAIEDIPSGGGGVSYFANAKGYGGKKAQVNYLSGNYSFTATAEVNE